MTIWYDNDNPKDVSRWNYHMIIKACQAIDFFKAKFSVEFIIGAGSRVRSNTYMNSLLQKNIPSRKLQKCKNIFVATFRLQLNVTFYLKKRSHIVGVELWRPYYEYVEEDNIFLPYEPSTSSPA